MVGGADPHYEAVDRPDLRVPRIGRPLSDDIACRMRVGKNEHPPWTQPTRAIAGIGRGLIGLTAAGGCFHDDQLFVGAEGLRRALHSCVDSVSGRQPGARANGIEEGQQSSFQFRPQL